MKSNERLPIQVVVPRETDYSADRGGGKTSFLCPFTEELRMEIENQCIALRESTERSFQKFPSIPCIGKVTMKEKAIAKSHKPKELFKSHTCPIVGSEKLDEILIKITPQGINHLINTVKSSTTKSVQANLTKIKRIEPYTIDDKIQITGYNSISSFDKPLKIKLFSLDDNADTQYFVRGFEELISRLNLTDNITKLSYGANLNIYKLECCDRTLVDQILEYPGVHKISFFSQYSCEFPNIANARKQIVNLPMPEEGVDYPIVGLIDSGIAKGHKYLEPWVYQREVYVAPEYQNNDHGTFVAGILQYGNILNFNAETQQHFKILDVVVFPNSDPEKGLTDSLSEDSLIDILHEVIERHCEKVKVWNMSLGTDLICGEIISDLAIALDYMQDQYGIEIILPTGNYVISPLRSWPPTVDLHDADRVTSPADSVRGITVGSIAHIKIDNYVDSNMPSPFSRKGPGANYLVKPDVVHYGGNCSDKLTYDGAGVVSFDINGNLIEGVGTSYSTPAITAIYAGLRHGVIEEYAREYAKAFIIHSATIPEAVKKQVPDYNKYFGYGKPLQSIEEILTCSKSSATLIFSGTLSSSTFIEFNDFPFPKSLMKDGKWYGEIKMTLVYTPKLNASYGQEYCRANIDAHFGTYDFIDAEGKVSGFSGVVPLEKKWDEKYEKSRVENGFKWNPIKSYSRLIQKGIDGKPWRLRIDSCARLGDDYEGQNFVLLITITDPNNNDIYTEIIQMLRERGYIYNDVKIHNKIRQSIGL